MGKTPQCVNSEPFLEPHIASTDLARFSRSPCQQVGVVQHAKYSVMNSFG